MSPRPHCRCCASPHTATDLTAGVGGGRPVEESAKVVVRMASIGTDGPTGTFQEEAGELGW